jgi:electron transport complex protein RnfD
MALLRISSPHAHTTRNTSEVMQLVALACLPGVAALTWFFGWGNVINIIFASIVAIICEALCLKLRKRPVAFYVKDYSAVVTAVLLALSIPPYSPWWLTMSGVAFAIIISKQLYGGLGFNPFNPAMVGYVVLLISFPIEMTSWPTPASISANVPGFIESLQLIFMLHDGSVDAITSATPLDLMKQNNSLTSDELFISLPVFANASLAATGYEWVNLAFLTGGLFLLQQRIYTWHAPFAFLLALALASALFNDGGSSMSKGSPLFHLLTGGTMLGAFFIITDPVTSPTTLKGRFWFGFCAGILVFIIRSWGNYPDAVAFAVLLMNLCAPTIEYYSLPRTYGHKRARRATEKEDNL